MPLHARHVFVRSCYLQRLRAELQTVRTRTRVWPPTCVVSYQGLSLCFQLAHGPPAFSSFGHTLSLLQWAPPVSCPLFCSRPRQCRNNAPRCARGLAGAPGRDAPRGPRREEGTAGPCCSPPSSDSGQFAGTTCILIPSRNPWAFCTGFLGPHTDVWVGKGILPYSSTRKHGFVHPDILTFQLDSRMNFLSQHLLESAPVSPRCGPPELDGHRAPKRLRARCALCPCGRRSSGCVRCPPARRSPASPHTGAAHPRLLAPPAGTYSACRGHAQRLDTVVTSQHGLSLMYHQQVAR